MAGGNAPFVFPDDAVEPDCEPSWRMCFRRFAVQPTREFLERRLRSWSSFAPCDQVVCIDGEAKHISWHKAKLGGAKTDYTDDDAVCACNHPAVPHSPSDQNSRGDGQQAGEVIESQH